MIYEVNWRWRSEDLFEVKDYIRLRSTLHYISQPCEAIVLLVIADCFGCLARQPRNQQRILTNFSISSYHFTSCYLIPYKAYKITA